MSKQIPNGPVGKTNELRMRRIAEGISQEKISILMNFLGYRTKKNNLCASRLVSDFELNKYEQVEFFSFYEKVFSLDKETRNNIIKSQREKNKQIKASQHKQITQLKTLKRIWNIIHPGCCVFDGEKTWLVVEITKGIGGRATRVKAYGENDQLVTFTANTFLKLCKYNNGIPWIRIGSTK